MDHLPSSIEAALSDAGFSGTEVLIVQRLLQENGITLRQLASKTGKSTGVLDQGMKKLLRRNIVRRDMVNETPKYVLHSLESVTQAIFDDITRKRDALLRRYRNVEDFVLHAETHAERPTLEFFEGVDGMERAYLKLLDATTELLVYMPTEHPEEGGALARFSLAYFRERRKRNIFSRVIAHDTNLGRRYQARDPFEYRQTVLLAEQSIPLPFERIIADDIVACFHRDAAHACFIRYPALASAERRLFDVFWHRSPPEHRSVAAACPLPSKPTGTSAISCIRGIILSIHSALFLSLAVLLSLAITYLQFLHTFNLTVELLQHEARELAAMGSLSFGPEVQAIRTEADVTKDEYKAIIQQLNVMRSSARDIRYIYLLRPTEQPGVFAFVADGDSLDPNDEIDTNGNGRIDPEEHLTPPGELFDARDLHPDSNEALIEAVGFEPDTDQWGNWISGWAPVRDNAGMTIAIFGIDIDMNDAVAKTWRSFAPIGMFLTTFFLMLIVRLLAVNPVMFLQIRERFSGFKQLTRPQKKIE